MFSKVVFVCLLGVALAMPEGHHYSSAEAVSSQNIVRYDQPAQNRYAGPAYHAAPTPSPLTYSAPAPVYHAAPAPVIKYAASAPVYHSAPAPVIKYTAPAPVFHAAPAPVIKYTAPTQGYQAAPAQVYHAAAAPVLKYAAAPVAKVYAQQPEEVAYPKYEYSYSVADGHTGDNKQQQESRDGDVVKGSYSFAEADGSVRTVEYTADDHNGFNAVVHNTAPTAAPAYVKSAPALLHAAPAPQYYQH